MKIMLVYQAGFANVFSVDNLSEHPKGRNARRLLQHDFHSCAWFARGVRAAGGEVATAHCNQAGDITNRVWSYDLSDAPFRDEIIEVRTLSKED